MLDITTLCPVYNTVVHSTTLKPSEHCTENGHTRKLILRPFLGIIFPLWLLLQSFFSYFTSHSIQTIVCNSNTSMNPTIEDQQASPVTQYLHLFFHTRRNRSLSYYIINTFYMWIIEPTWGDKAGLADQGINFHLNVNTSSMKNTSDKSSSNNFKGFSFSLQFQIMSTWHCQ